LNLNPAKLLLALACLVPIRAGAQQVFTGSAEIVPEQVDRMYLKGMDYLARTQLPAGNWADATPGPAAIPALAVVSLLARGDDPNFGPYSQTIHRGLDFLLKQQDAKTGYIGPTMYNHGFATLALAESYGAVNDDRLGPALQKAVRLILNSQARNPAKAWRYSPEAPDADTTVSGAQMVALMAARSRLRTFSAGSPWPNTAFPATRTSAPERTTEGMVLSAMPPSTSIRKPRPREARIMCSLRILAGDEAINFCPPKPGFTDITST